MKVKTKVRQDDIIPVAADFPHKDAYKQVYNWQYVHSLDFWSIVLGRACDTQGVEAASELQALIYPLVQVSLGAIRYVFQRTRIPTLS